MMWFSAVRFKLALCLYLHLAANTLSANATCFYKDKPCEIITRDILIIGGGSSGTYGAMKLIDSNKTILVEKQPMMGRHTDTYIDPATNTTIDFGVVVFHNNNFVRQYFRRFGVPLTTSSDSTHESIPVDFETGVRVVNYVVQNPGANKTVVEGYLGQLGRYPYLEKGFELPDPVPGDLLIPFGAFLRKHQLEEMAQTIFSFGQGLVNILKQPTIYALKICGTEVMQDAFYLNFLTTTRHNNEIYTKAADELLASNSLLLSSHIISMIRTSHGVQALVSTPTGVKLIRAKRVLITIPPKMERSLLHKGFDLSVNEQSLFSQFNNSAYYSALVRNTGIPDNTTLFNASPSAPYNIPTFPGLYMVASTRLSGLFDVKYGSPYVLPDSAVKAAMVSAIASLPDSLTTARTRTQGQEDLEFAAFSRHSPFLPTVSVAAIRNGFYRDLYKLQGVRGTWWTGATWHTQDSSLLWEFTDGVVERMLKTL